MNNNRMRFIKVQEHGKADKVAINTDYIVDFGPVTTPGTKHVSYIRVAYGNVAQIFWLDTPYAVLEHLIGLSQGRDGSDGSKIWGAK